MLPKAGLKSSDTKIVDLLRPAEEDGDRCCRRPGLNQVIYLHYKMVALSRSAEYVAYTFIHYLCVALFQFYLLIEVQCSNTELEMQFSVTCALISMYFVRHVVKGASTGGVGGMSVFNSYIIIIYSEPRIMKNELG